MPEKRYIQVILPLRLEWEPCYCLDGADTSAQVRVGDRIMVSFASRPYAAVVSAVDVTPDIDPSRISPVLSLESGLAPVSEKEIEFWRFIADYYLCSVGEVYRAAYPLERVRTEEASARRARRMESAHEAESARLQQKAARLRTRLEAKDAALAGRHSDAVLVRLRSERASLAGQLEQVLRQMEELSSRGVFDGVHTPVIKPVKSRLWQKISWDKPLLYRSPDRSEEYIAAASNCLAGGGCVLLLVPDSGLAVSLEVRFREAFGSSLLVSHSGLSASQRNRLAASLRSGEPFILLGTRSAVFLPFKSLSLVIVDREESPFYKNGDSAPRYNARDAAIMLARIHHAPVILGSSSPSLESEYNVACSKFVRFEDVPVRSRPVIIDTTLERRKNGMLGCISRKLAAMCGKGRIALVRGFEKEEEVLRDLQSVFPGEEERFSIFTIAEALRRLFSDFDAVALLSADALLQNSDFRSDERAFQFIDSLLSSCPEVIIQTRNSAHQVFSSGGASGLMEERRVFSLPPFRRLVDLILPNRGPDISYILLGRLRSAGFDAAGPLVRPDGRMIVRVSLDRGRRFSEKKKALRGMLDALSEEPLFRGRITPDADPV